MAKKKTTRRKRPGTLSKIRLLPLIGIIMSIYYLIMLTKNYKGQAFAYWFGYDIAQKKFNPAMFFQGFGAILTGGIGSMAASKIGVNRYLPIKI